jgi:5-methylthioadenosine/S-adenosylhomocysteine deaminase
MRMCALLQKVTHLNSEVMPAETAFALGTAGSAEALGLPAGRIEAGHYGDFVLLDMDDPSLQPPFSYEKNIVYAMTPHAIRTVIIGGRTVLQDDKLALVSWEEVLGGLQATIAAWS